MTLLRALGAGIVVTVLSTPMTASAEPPPRPSAQPALPGDPKTPYEEARALYASGDYKGSLAALERAQRLSPDPRLFWNMAACEKKLGHHAKAIGHVERYLAGAASVLSADEKRDATQFLSAASAYVGSVTITSNVDDTQVLIDDEPAGATPFAKALVVDQGERRIRFARSGYRAAERTERVWGGAELHWSVELEPERPPAGDVPPPRVVAPPEARHAPAPVPTPSRVGPLVAGGGGIVVLGAGAVLVGISLSNASQLRADCGTTCPPSRWEKFRTLQTSGDILLGTGAVALATAIVWWIVQPSGAPSAGLRAAAFGATF